MATVQDPQLHDVVDHHPELPSVLELKIYSHSMFFYWWPMWAAGFVMALLTWMQGVPITIGDRTELFHPSKNVGIVYIVIVMLTILFTNVSLRGVASVVAILSIAFVTLLFAYLGLWDNILGILPYLSAHMNLGFYVTFSTVMFAAWAFVTFIYDHLEFYRIKPGQLTHEFLIGGAEKTYDTRGMVLEKNHEDMFRHWLLGLGSGDVKIIASGAKNVEINLTNVLFVDWKVDRVQELLAVKPEVVAQIQ